MRTIYQQIFDRLQKHAPLALVTVTGTRGSAPQKPGSSAIFGEAGHLWGTVGGGAVEGKIQKIVASAILTRVSGQYHFDLGNDIRNQDEAICGGEISILVDATPGDHYEVFRNMNRALADRTPGVLVTGVTRLHGSRVAITRDWVARSLEHDLPAEQAPLLEPAINQMLADCRPGDYRDMPPLPDSGGTHFYLEAVCPLPRLVIAGAGHIGKALAHLGSLLDFEVTVMDDRAEYANPENIPDADHLIVDDIGRAMLELDKSPDTHIVLVTRGHKNDSDALRSCIGSGAGYIGMIGSARKIELVREKFMDEGWATPIQWESVYAPIGLEISSKTVQEIAVSIAAQLVHVRNRKI
jgi:xanthine dehydrogenase accessory factor